MNVQPKEAQGSNYEYNNVNTMLLSPVIESIFSSEAHDVLINEIFKPLGIEKYGLWSDVAGNDMTYYGVDLTPKDFLKFTNMIANGGIYNGNQIVNKAFLAESTKPLSEGVGEWFGLHWSIRKFNGVKTFNPIVLSVDSQIRTKRFGP